MMSWCPQVPKSFTYSFSHANFLKRHYFVIDQRYKGLMLSALASGSSGRDSNPGWEQCVMFLGKTLDSHSASLLLL